MRLVASEMPSLSLTALDGRVHSVFRRVVNARLASGELLALYAGDDSDPPGSVSVSAPVDFDFSKHVGHGAAISCRAGVLRIGGSALSIDLRQARQRETASMSTFKDSIGADFSAAWHTAWQTLVTSNGSAGLIVSLNGRRPAGSLDAALANRARQIIPQLLDATRIYDIDGAVDSAGLLVGAGPGLTPSGDDFLAGFLIGARHTAPTEAETMFLDRLGRTLSKQYGNSGDIGCDYLTKAARGIAAQPLAKLAKSISESGNANKVKTAMVVAMHVGHSSGADATFGLLSGLAAWHPELAAAVGVGLVRSRHLTATEPRR